MSQMAASPQAYTRGRGIMPIGGARSSSARLLAVLHQMWVSKTLGVRRELVRTEPLRLDLAEELAYVLYLSMMIGADPSVAADETAILLDPFARLGYITPRAQALLDWAYRTMTRDHARRRRSWRASHLGTGICDILGLSGVLASAWGPGCAWPRCWRWLPCWPRRGRVEIVADPEHAGRRWTREYAVWRFRRTH